LRSLESKIALLLAAAILLYGAVDYVIQRSVIFPSFLELERDLAQKDLARCVAAIRREIEHVDTVCWDWASWDDTYDFVQSRSQEYIASNMVLGTFVDGDISLIYILDTEGSVIWGQMYDLETEEPFTVTEFPEDAFPKTHPLIDHQIRESPLPHPCVSGIFSTDHGPILVSCRPILNSNDEGPIRGHFIMGRFLNENTVASLANQTQVSFEVFPVQDDALAEPIREISGRLTEASPLVIEKEGHDYLLVYTSYPDIGGKPGVLIRARIAREITARGYDTLRYVITSMAVPALILLLLMLFLFRRTVLLPIRALTDHAFSVGKTADLSRRLAMKRQDEIGTLAREFDGMLGQLMATHNDLHREVRERKRAEEGLQRAQVHLEKRVAERTADLERMTVDLEQELAERKRTEEALRESEQRYSELVQNSPDPIVSLDKTGSFLSFNPAAEHISGFSKEEVLGRHFAKTGIVAPESLSKTLEEFQSVLKGGDRPPFELTVMRKDKGLLILEANPRLTRDKKGSVQVTLRDVSERKRAEEALRRAHDELDMRVKERTAELARANEELFEEIAEREAVEQALESERDKLQGVLNAIGEGLYIVNGDFYVEYHNEVLSESFGPSKGKRCYSAFFQSNEPCEFCLMRDVMASGRIRSAEATSTEGRSYDIVFSPFKDTDGSVKTIVSLWDTTEKVTLQAEAMRAGHLASLGELSAGVAHEINNPVNSMIGLAEILREKCLEEGKNPDLPNRIINEGGRIAHIVRNLLSFARDQKEEFGPVPVKDIIMDSLSLMESRMMKDGIRLSVDLPSDLPEIKAHSQEIQQVCLNILSNAQYALNKRFPGPHEDKTLEIRGEAAAVDGRRHVRITFHDGGAGIPKSRLGRIIDPFFSTKPRGEGTGLGLSITHGIVENHGGKLSFESAEGQYTKVFVDLPAYDAWSALKE